MRPLLALLAPGLAACTSSSTPASPPVDAGAEVTVVSCEAGSPCSVKESCPAAPCPTMPCPPPPPCTVFDTACKGTDLCPTVSFTVSGQDPDSGSLLWNAAPGADCLLMAMRDGQVGHVSWTAVNAMGGNQSDVNLVAGRQAFATVSGSSQVVFTTTLLSNVPLQPPSYFDACIGSVDGTKQLGCLEYAFTTCP